MSEVIVQLAGETSADAESPHKPSAGELLRQARESGGLHIAALAVAMKVPVKKLEALEADRLDLLPDAVFVRALASSVCRTLKIDPAPVLNLLPQTAAPRLEYGSVGLNTPFQTPGDISRVSLWNQLSRPVVLAALALLAGALVLILFPSMEGGSVSRMTASEIVEPASPSSLPSPSPTAAASMPVAGDITPVVAALPDRQTEPQALQAQPAPAVIAPAASLVAVHPAPVASSAVTAPVQGKATANGVIVFRTRGPSWVEVTDAQGGVQIRRTVSVGEVVGVSGPLPLSVVVGRADVTDVQVRGKPFSLGALTRDNVARFEVK